ncbi:marine proteobacterial sortase target protein [Pelagibius sp.]|uniref:marine proteobacterial sortase target protein n=1 Tax=Pelagibius sp. TaxID=1931238 RepID=UPI0026261B45|nr:marine proteobacterial sortase target protein [Pelagibius sp.]
MRHKILPYRPASLIPPQTIRACLRSVLVVSGALGTALALLLLAIFARGLPTALGAEAAGPTKDRLPAGLYFYAGKEGGGLEAPTLSSDVTMTVNGMVNRVTLRQVFRNPTIHWLEGVYVFPLPERSAVDRLTMTVGERQVQGRILERAEAERAYKAAAENGQRASLVSGERPNVFVTAVANIGPGEEIAVEIGYQDAAAYENGVFSLRFPMVVAPRYSPAPEPRDEAPVAGGPTPAPLQPVVSGPSQDEARDLFGPVATDGETRNPLSLTVLLNAGVELQALRSLHHAVVIESRDGGLQEITLQAGQVPADRDFVLEWTPVPSAAPQAAVFAEEVGGEAHLLVMMVPPSSDEIEAPEPDAPRPRELVFVIDTSGSMHGESLDQAKAAVIAALKRLNPEDRFNVIQFNSVTYALYRRPVEASVANVARAFHYVSALESDGGTEMAPALDLALTGGAPDEHLQQVVFLTDGAVGNEEALFRIVGERLEQRRLFTVGIGAAPNSYFMRKAAELGRGSFTHIGKLDEVATRMEALFAKLENPALTDIRVGWPNAAGKRVETYPSPLPDLYAGEPVTFSARLGGVALAELEGQMLVTGDGPQGPWQQRLSLDGLSEAPGTASLWARAKLAAIEDRLYQPGDTPVDPAAIRADALALALEHQMVTRYTSLVAIDEAVARPDDAPLSSEEIPRDLPAGWDAGKVFGDSASQDQSAALRRHALASAPALFALQGFQDQAVTLPQTATPAERMVIIGGAYLLFGLGLLLLVLFRRRRLEQNLVAKLA